MNKKIFKQEGVALIAIVIAILIIAMIAFGAMKWQGTVKQDQEIKNKVEEDLKNINDNLEKNNQEIRNNLENN